MSNEKDYILEVNHLKKYFPIKGGFFGGVTGEVKALLMMSLSKSKEVQQWVL